MGRHYDRATVLYDLGRYADAAGELQQEVAEEPENSSAWGLLAMTLARLERFPQAETAVKAAIACDPDSGYVHFAASRVRMARDDEKGALAAIREALRLDPTDTRYHQTYAALLFHTGRWGDSLAAARRALEIDSQQVMAWIVQAHALVQLGRSSEVEQSLRDAIRVAPMNHEAHAAIGELLLIQRDARAAVDHLLESRRLNPNEFAGQQILASALGCRMLLFRIPTRLFSYWRRLPPWLQALAFVAVGVTYWELGTLNLRRFEPTRQVKFGAAAMMVILVGAFYGRFTRWAATIVHFRKIGVKFSQACGAVLKLLGSLWLGWVASVLFAATGACLCILGLAAAVSLLRVFERWKKRAY